MMRNQLHKLHLGDIMTEPISVPPLTELLQKEHYDIDTLESEIRADRNCTQLLKHFHQWLLCEKKLDALKAGQLASGADYFLREFLIGARRQNIFSASSEQLRQFGGNWYIINNLEPNVTELKPMLQGAAHFYKYCADLNIFSSATEEAIEKTTQQSEFFTARIEGFHQLKDDGYAAWDQACPLK